MVENKIKQEKIINKTKNNKYKTKFNKENNNMTNNGI